MAITVQTNAGVSSISAPVPLQKIVTYNMCLNASIGTTTFFIADRAYTVVGIKYAQKTQGSVDATCTVTKDTGTAAPGAGTALLTTAFDCVATANNTVVSGTLSTTASDLVLAAGNRLAVKFAGTLTTLAGVVVSVYLEPANDVDDCTATFFCRPNADMPTVQTFFIAPHSGMSVTGVKAVYATAFAGAITIDVVKDTGTTACGGGTSVLLAAMAGDATINTVITPSLAASASTLALAAGDRLAVKLSATTTGVNLCVSVTLSGYAGEQYVSWNIAASAQQQVAQCFCIADRNYEVIEAAYVFDVTAGGPSQIGISRDKLTDAPGVGLLVQQDFLTTGAGGPSVGFNSALTARVVQWMTPASLNRRSLRTGDRLGLRVNGGAQNTVLTCGTVTMIPKT